MTVHKVTKLPKLHGSIISVKFGYEKYQNIYWFCHCKREEYNWRC